ncbi:MAG TPA: PRC-barrel domain-containing protein [Beijerinckiaceae bacterium]|jgi:hypothetical protein
MASSSGSQHVITQQQPGQWLASKLIGTTVVGPNNESIGDVNDVLMEKDGRAAAVIVGVGGFLGIGEKDVAVPFGQLEFTSRAANASTAHTTGSTSATGQSGPGTTGSTSSGATASANSSGVPDRIMVRMTKQDLQNAPKFARADQRHDTTSTGATGGSGSGRGTTGTAPAAPGGGSQAPKQ